MTVIEGWTLLSSARYDDHGTEMVSVMWRTTDDRVCFWRSDGIWRSSAENAIDRQTLTAAGIQAGDALGINLKQFVTLISSIIGCETTLKRGITIYTLEGTYINLMHDGDGRWHLLYPGTSEGRPNFDHTHEQACREARGPHRTRAIALRQLNNKIEELLSMPV